MPPRTLVKGVPGRYSPIPEWFDRSNIRGLTTSTGGGMWIGGEDPDLEELWPDYWPERFAD